MCKGGSQTSTTSSSANPAAMAAYTDLLNRAQGVAATPYTPYGGELVAPINAQQQTGIAGINAGANFASPYIQRAADMATSAAQPISASDIQRYISPYTQGVVDQTQAQFNNQNQQQQQQVVGNAIAKGAFGGNRVAVAQAELANQQQLAQAPVIANLYNTGYQSAVNTALTQQQQQAAGAYSLGNLGVAGQNAALTGANAQLGAGTLQQQNQQAADLAAYEQWMAKQAYPFQTTQWLAGLATGVGSQMGGTNTTTQPGPSGLSQIGGALTSGIGILGGTGAFGSAGWLAPALMALKSGGGVSSDAGQGIANAPETIPETDETLQAQQAQLRGGYRAAQMFPTGTPELDLPEGMERLETDNGIFHYDPRRIDADRIRQATAEGKENEVLGLGSISKEEVLQRIQAGEKPVAIVERDGSGVEVRAALGTEQTAETQIEEMERGKSPGNTVSIEDPRVVLGQRLQRRAGGVVLQRGVGGGAAAGGMQTGVAGAPYGGVQLPYAASRGFVPAMDITRGRGVPTGSAGVAGSQDKGSSLADQAKNIGQLAQTLKSSFNGPTNIVPDGAQFTSSGVGDLQPMGVSPQAWMPGGSPVYNRGGAVGSHPSIGIANFPDRNAIMVPKGYAAGGSPDFAGIMDQAGIGTDFIGSPPMWAEAVGAGDFTPVDRGPGAPLTKGIAPVNGVAGAWESGPGTVPAWPGESGSFDAAQPLPAPREVGPPPGGVAPNATVYRSDNLTPIQRQIVSEAKAQGVDPAFALRVARQESGARQFDRDGRPIISRAGAVGVMQLMPGTADELGVDPMDAADNIRGGVAYLRQMLDRYDGDPKLAAAAYNAGPGRVDAYLSGRGRLPAETMAYVPAVTDDQSSPFSDRSERRGSPRNEEVGEAAPEGVAGIDLSANSKLWPSLMAAGFGMMASRSPFPGVAIGEGGMAGLNTYQGLKQAETATKLKKSEIDLRAKTLSRQLDRDDRQFRHQENVLDETRRGRRAAEAENERAHRENETIRREAIEAGRYTWVPGTGQDENGNVVQGMWRNPTRGNDEPKFYPGMVQTGRGGAGKSVAQWKYETWLSNHPGDIKGAEDFAAGRRTMSEAEIRKAAANLAQKDLKEDATVAGNPSERERRLKDRTDHWIGVLTGHPAAAPTSPATSAPAATKPTAAPPMPAGVPAGSVYGQSKKSGRWGWMTPDGKFLVSSEEPAP